MARPHYEKNNSGRKQVNSEGLVGIAGWHIWNGTAAVMFVQMFDAKAIGNVTLGTTVPDMVLAIPATSLIQAVMTEQSKIQFQRGFVYAVTTQNDNGTAPTFGTATDTGDVTFFIE